MSEIRPVEEDVAVHVAALLAGRIDGQQAVAGLSALVARIKADAHAAGVAEGRALLERVEALAEVLAEHERGPSINSRERWTECLCGARTPWLDHEDADEHDDSHRLHVAAALAGTSPQGEGECRRDHAGPCFVGRPDLCRNILRDRRDQVHDHRDDATAIGDSTGWGGPVGGGRL